MGKGLGAPGCRAPGEPVMGTVGLTVWWLCGGQERQPDPGHHAKQGGRIDPLHHGAPQGTQEGTQRCFVPCPASGTRAPRRASGAGGEHGSPAPASSNC